LLRRSRSPWLIVSPVEAMMMAGVWGFDRTHCPEYIHAPPAV
jgi:hypothetical protein